MSHLWANGMYRDVLGDEASRLARIAEDNRIALARQIEDSSRARERMREDGRAAQARLLTEFGCTRPAGSGSLSGPRHRCGSDLYGSLTRPQTIESRLETKKSRLTLSKILGYTAIGAGYGQGTALTFDMPAGASVAIGASGLAMARMMSRRMGHVGAASGPVLGAATAFGAFGHETARHLWELISVVGMGCSALALMGAVFADDVVSRRQNRPMGEPILGRILPRRDLRL
jgi:hypothetical protein